MRGYPEDRRTEAQRLRAARDIVGDAEAKAARAVARLLDEHVVLQDDNSAPGTPDIRIDFTDGRVGHVEVVVDIDPAYAKTSEHIVRAHFQMPAAGLSRNWFAMLDRQANLKLVKQELPDLLISFEATARYKPDVTDGPGRDALRRLGVLEISSAERNDGTSGILHISPEGASGPGDIPTSWFTEELDRLLIDPRFDDVWGKLAEAGADERHAFIGLSFTTVWPLYHMLRPDVRHLPDAPPRLPEPATHLWLMILPTGWRCLHWSPTQGWLDAEDH